MAATKIKELEVCCATEWLRDHVLRDLAPDGWENESADALYGELLWRLRDAGFVPVQARGQRQFCDGWNGANTFTHKGELLPYSGGDR